MMTSAVEELLVHDNRFRYMMLDRLRSDCGYYLNYGNRSANVLWAKDEKDHIDAMKKLFKSFTKEDEPEFITWQDILDFEEAMIPTKSASPSKGGNVMKKSYLVVVDSEFVRDTQLATVPEADHESDDWIDATGQIVLGTYTAEEEDKAIEAAANEHHLSGDTLSAYQMAPSEVHVGIRMEGGNIQSVFTDHPTKVVFIDYDTLAYEEEELIEMEPRSKAYVSVSQADVMPEEFVDLKAILERNNRSFESN